MPKLTVEFGTKELTELLFMKCFSYHLQSLRWEPKMYLEEGITKTYELG